MDIRVDLQSLTTITSSITDGQDRLRDDVLGSLSILPASASKMLEEKMVVMFQKHTEQIETKTAELLIDQDNRLDPLIRRPPKTRRPVRAQNSKSPQGKNTT